MASDDQKKDQVRNAYPGKWWKDKVDHMRPDQITAIYLRLKARGKV
jgi:hypothetical protein